jgi:hypothetical protein
MVVYSDTGAGASAGYRRRVSEYPVMFENTKYEPEPPRGERPETVDLTLRCMGVRRSAQTLGVSIGHIGLVVLGVNARLDARGACSAA